MTKKEQVLEQLNRIPKWWSVEQLETYFDFGIKRILTSLEKEGVIESREGHGKRKEVKINPNHRW